MKQEYFEIGQIVNTFGIKGFVKVNPFTDDMERFAELKSEVGTVYVGSSTPTDDSVKLWVRI